MSKKYTPTGKDLIDMQIAAEDHTKDILKALNDAKQRGLNAIGMVAERHAKEAAPVDTGRLRNSITWTTDGDAAYIGTNVEYAPYVELGTHRTKAKPFLKPAATEHGAEYRELMKKSMED